MRFFSKFSQLRFTKQNTLSFLSTQSATNLQPGTRSCRFSQLGRRHLAGRRASQGKAYAL